MPSRSTREKTMTRPIADQRRDRSEEHRVQGRARRARAARRRARGYAPAGSRSAATAAANRSPRSSADANMSNEAQPGESKTTPPGPASSRARCHRRFHRGVRRRGMPVAARAISRPASPIVTSAERAARIAAPISSNAVPFGPTARDQDDRRVEGVAARRSPTPDSSTSNRRRSARRRSRATVASRCGIGSKLATSRRASACGAQPAASAGKQRRHRVARRCARRAAESHRAKEAEPAADRPRRRVHQRCSSRR